MTTPRGPRVLRLGLLLLLILTVAAAAAPWLAPYPPNAQDLAHRLEGPDRSHPLGRDDLGRDVLSRSIWGTRTSLGTGILVVLISASFGVLAGASAGLAGGALDALLVATIDLLLSFPGVLLAIALVAVRGPRWINLIVALCAIGWVAYARLARSSAMRLRQLEFVEAARAVGATLPRLLARHLLPNLLGPVIVQASLGLGGVIMAEAGLSFLGLGVPPPTPSWGSILRAGTQNLMDAPHLTIVPGGAILLAVLGAQLLGEGLRARLDPRGDLDPGP
jgi:peptide/nickel transport system permease protein